MKLLNPKNETYSHLDEKSRNLMLKTIDFFEKKGKMKLMQDDHDKVWYADFLEFVKKEKAFSILMTPSGYGPSDSRWDCNRIMAFNEILGFYGLCYWYTWQVTMLGLGPIWISKNEEIKKKAAKLLEDGEIFAFGLSEKEHGADLIGSDMMLIPNGDGTYKASGDKFYIGNGNKAAIVSTFGKMQDTGEFVFFGVNSQHKNYELKQNIVTSQNYVAEFELHDYPITEADIISKGRAAWDTSLATIAFCKFNLGWGSVGICTHAFYEALNHAAHRRLFNQYVTDFPHIKQLFMDAYTRLLAMKMFSRRATDYMRTASATDKRYLLFNPMEKMKVTTQGEEVVINLWDIIAAKGLNKDAYFEMAIRDIQMLPRLEGTVHVNMVLIMRFMQNYFFSPDSSLPEIGQVYDIKDDTYLFNQGATTKGFDKIKFHDYNIAYSQYQLPNIKIFREQIALFKELLEKAEPTKGQREDIGFMLTVGEMFTLVAYGQLVLENAKLEKVEEDIIDQIFDFLVRDFSKYATQLYSKPTSTEAQQEICKKILRKPILNEERFERIYKNQLMTLVDTYEMNR
ncbi:acyl-CoA dehydrogenase [Leptospira idonii]|uniref:Acyl-CoA dehydrogenase n=1 Tax=Leptospira idonii TaxID=1193500 RepID=A0A4R9LVG0_9LEPT|nr:acyl-CoA dehydrogenase [Leptospira idonii]TGN18224.1 acyl-CoA dehydrogenase [Leptospira idonii]